MTSLAAQIAEFQNSSRAASQVAAEPIWIRDGVLGAGLFPGS